jgi:hypothetical protein
MWQFLVSLVDAGFQAAAPGDDDAQASAAALREAPSARPLRMAGAGDLPQVEALGQQPARCEPHKRSTGSRDSRFDCSALRRPQNRAVSIRGPVPLCCGRDPARRSADGRAQARDVTR